MDRGVTRSRTGAFTGGGGTAGAVRMAADIHVDPHEGRRLMEMGIIQGAGMGPRRSSRAALATQQAPCKCGEPGRLSARKSEILSEVLGDDEARREAPLESAGSSPKTSEARPC